VNGEETPEQTARRLKLEADCSRVGRKLAEQLKPGVGFALLMFDFGEGGNLAYLSNAQRSDMIKTLREFIEKLEGGK
jgi:hypothetical protein